MKKLTSLLDGIEAKNLRSLSKLISLAENEDAGALPTFAKLYEKTGNSRVLGLTGPPGAGKSSLTNSFVKFLREKNKTVAVVAIDPVSPFSGGAILGDRIRLVDHFNDPGVFIRSLSTRGKLGGLSIATREAVHALGAFGFDYILVETVGVGQSEVDIRNLADVTLVVLVPEWGDSIQTIKAGLLEIGDIFTVNKADREGADRLLTELKTLCQISHRESTPVLLSSQIDDTSLRTLLSAVETFFDGHSSLISERRKRFAREAAAELLERSVRREVRHWVEQKVTGDSNPYQFLLDFEKTRSNHPLFSK